MLASSRCIHGIYGDAYPLTMQNYSLASDLADQIRKRKSNLLALRRMWNVKQLWLFRRAMVYLLTGGGHGVSGYDGLMAHETNRVSRCVCPLKTVIDHNISDREVLPHCHDRWIEVSRWSLEEFERPAPIVREQVCST